MMTANVAAHTVLVTNRRATRSMLAMTRRPSATTPGNVAKRLSSSTSSATDFAADVPAPIAIPRSASKSVAELVLRRLDELALDVGRDPSKHGDAVGLGRESRCVTVHVA